MADVARAMPDMRGENWGGGDYVGGFGSGGVWAGGMVVQSVGWGWGAEFGG